MKKLLFVFVFMLGFIACNPGKPATASVEENDSIEVVMDTVEVEAVDSVEVDSIL